MEQVLLGYGFFVSTISISVDILWKLKKKTLFRCAGMSVYKCLDFVFVFYKFSA